MAGNGCTGTHSYSEKVFMSSGSPQLAGYTTATGR
jgi:hypothetical protein